MQKHRSQTTTAVNEEGLKRALFKYLLSSCHAADKEIWGLLWFRALQMTELQVITHQDRSDL